MFKANFTAAMDSVKHRFGGDFAEEVRSHFQKHYKRQDALHKAWGCGDRRKIRSLQNLMLTSYSSHLVSVINGVRRRKPAKQGAGDQLRRRLTPAEIDEIAKDLNPFKDCGEAVTMKDEPKSSGVGTRVTFSFGPRRRALHSLCIDILVAQSKPRDFDFMCRGKGADAASDHINYLVAEKGCNFFVYADIQNFFGSVQLQAARSWLDLPDAVLAHCIWLRPGVPVIHDGRHTRLCECAVAEGLDGAVRPVLPQGSRASQVVASMLLGAALEQFAPIERIIVYGDDIALAARTQEEAAALQMALISALECHPSGPFRFKHLEIAHIDHKFDFLKYRHVRKPLHFGGHLHRRPSFRCYNRYGRRLRELARTTPDSELDDAVDLYRKRWSNSFPRWNRTEDAEVCLEVETLNIIRDHRAAKD